MIKNILYSLFLHLLLFALIYINFKSHISDETNELKEGIAISIASFDNQKSSAATEIAPKTEKKKEVKKAPSPKKIAEKKPDKPQKPKEKAEIKEAKKPETKKAAAEKKHTLPSIAEKHNEFKPEEAKEEPKKAEQEKPKEEEKEPEIQLTKAETDEEIIEEMFEEAAAANPTENIVNDLENLNLSAREKYNIHSQLRGCYHHALHDNYNNNFSITVQVTVLPDGTISFDSEKLIDMVRYKNPKEKAYREMMDGIVKALEFCSPLRNMPADKYDVWKEFTIQFGTQ